ncbi:cell division cycle protein 27 homolog B-like [Hibiscus syriacus]|uniref:cell division cycle protein 27 homolog B-like n=1 Tax=Hibiscus syriacus TaxID=106335 RepID=UPI001924B3CA|nr:cell division cycle protein 27 homolog B-like [Hibiscus syriacus]
MKRSVEHFRKVLSIDPLFWAAYEELCMLGEDEEGAVYFGDAAIPCVQEHYLGNPSSCLLIAGTGHNLGSSQRFGFKDLSLCHLQQKEEEKTRDICQNNHGGPILTGVVGQITNNCCNTPSLSTPSPVPTQIRGSLFYD